MASERQESGGDEMRGVRRAPSAPFPLALALVATLAFAAPALAQSAPQPATPAAPGAGPNPSLTISPKDRAGAPPMLTEDDRRALDAYASAPSLTDSRGLAIGPLYGPNDEDCIKAGSETICRQ